MDKDGYISNGELFLVLKMMVGNNLKDVRILESVIENHFYMNDLDYCFLKELSVFTLRKHLNNHTSI